MLICACRPGESRAEMAPWNLRMNVTTYSERSAAPPQRSHLAGLGLQTLDHGAQVVKSRSRDRRRRERSDFCCYRRWRFHQGRGIGHGSRARSPRERVNRRSESRGPLVRRGSESRGKWTLYKRWGNWASGSHKGERHQSCRAEARGFGRNCSRDSCRAQRRRGAAATKVAKAALGTARRARGSEGPVRAPGHTSEKSGGPDHKPGCAAGSQTCMDGTLCRSYLGAVPLPAAPLPAKMAGTRTPLRQFSPARSQCRPASRRQGTFLVLGR
jgi:hypothetical protein